MKALTLMAAVLLTACGGPLNETEDARAEATQTSTSALAAKDTPRAPDRFDMCVMACRGLDEPYRAACYEACTDDAIQRAPH